MRASGAAFASDPGVAGAAMGGGGENAGAGGGSTGTSIVRPMAVASDIGGAGSTSGAVITCGGSGAVTSGGAGAITGGDGGIGAAITRAGGAVVAAGRGALDNAGAHAASASESAAMMPMRVSCGVCAACGIMMGSWT